MTPSGFRIVRVSANKVSLGDVREIDLSTELQVASPRVETNTSTKLTGRRRAASQGEAAPLSHPLASSSSKRMSRDPGALAVAEIAEPEKEDTPEKRLGALDLSTGARLMATVRALTGSAPVKSHVPSLRPPQLLPGEKELFVCQEVEYVVNEAVVHPGTVFLTNYQLLFRSSDARQSIREVSLAPLGKITRIEKVGGKKSSLLHSSLTRQLVIHCKDFHKSIVIRMASANAGQRKQLFELINKLAFPGKIASLFAFSYDPSWSHPTKAISPHLSTLLRSDLNIGINGWNLFSFEHDFERIGVFERTLRDGRQAWRWSDVNASYALCKSYPERFVVPHAISDTQLQKVAQFRTQSRVPMLSWVHKNGASISRCSQPKSGLVTARCAEDELLLGLIRETVDSEQYPLVIIDPRPRTNAEANRAVGAGYEKEANYAKTKVHFMGIGNIHVVRDSQQQLATLCAQVSGRTDSFWLSGVESSGWLKHIKTILAAATLITKCISQYAASCLVHCSDGWDRTSQVVSLAMLCMDPYYRTISGFCILVEKEWCRAGHMFATRYGHGSKNYSDDMRAPIFLQWIDCVWQVFRQYITSFEFNENFLIRVVEEVCNGRFGTFLADSESMQKELQLASKTVSLWTYIHHKDNFYRFTNPLYSPPLSSSTLGSKTPVVLIPKCSIFALSFWSNSYLQGSNFRDRIVEMSTERAFELNCRIEDLELRIQELEIENAELKGVPPPTHATGSSFGIGLGLALGYGADVLETSSAKNSPRNLSKHASSPLPKNASSSSELSNNDSESSSTGAPNGVQLNAGADDSASLASSGDLKILPTVYSVPTSPSGTPVLKKGSPHSRAGGMLRRANSSDVSSTPTSPSGVENSPRKIGVIGGVGSASASVGNLDSISPNDSTKQSRQKAPQRTSGDIALDEIIQDLTHVGTRRFGAPKSSDGPQSSTRPSSSRDINNQTASDTTSAPVLAPEQTCPSSPTTPSFHYAPNRNENEPPATIGPAFSLTHPPAIRQSLTQISRHAVRIPRGTSPGNSSSSHLSEAPPTMYIDDDIDLNEALSLDTPRVRGDPEWGNVNMMIEDYAPSESSKPLDKPHTVRG